MQIERELKFRLPARLSFRVWNLLPGTPTVHRRSVESVYYDTPDLRLRTAHAALRLRRDGRRSLMCFKCEGAPAAGLAQRSEWEVPAMRGVPAPEELPLEEIAEATQIDLRRLIPHLAPVFTTRFTRQSVEIALPGGTAAELCIDEGRIIAGRRSVPLRELELELREGSLDAMLEFAAGLVAPLALALEPLSKAERGYRLAASEPSAPVKAQPPALTRDGSAEAAMLEVLQACLAQVEANAWGVAHARDPEYLHQLRVGLRRLRAALRVFEPLASSADIRVPVACLREFSPVLGSARDWDVFCTGLAPYPRLLRRARPRRAAARAQARQLAGSARFQAFLLDLLRWMHQASWRRTGDKEHRLWEQPIARYARRALARAERRLQRQGTEIDWTDAAARHRLRIRAKRLRYACEPFASLYPPRRTLRYLERLEALQDVLGELNDIAVGRRLLRELDGGKVATEARLMRAELVLREKRLVKRLGAVWRAWRKAKQPW